MYDVRGSFRRYPIPCENRQRRGRGNCISPAHCKGSLLAIVTNCWLPIVVLCPSTPDSLNPSRLGGTHLPPPHLLFGKLRFNACLFSGYKVSLFETAKRYKSENITCKHWVQHIYNIYILVDPWSACISQQVDARIPNCSLCSRYWLWGECNAEWPFERIVGPEEGKEAL